MRQVIRAVACLVIREKGKEPEQAIMVFGAKQNYAIDANGEPIPAPIQEYILLEGRGCFEFDWEAPANWKYSRKRKK